MKKRSYTLTLAGAFLFSLSTLAVPGRVDTKPDLVSIKDVLSKPLEERRALINNDPVRERILRRMVFDQKYHLKDRWQAFRSLASMKDKDSKKLIKKALASKEWFLRDAALKSAAVYYPNAAKKMAKKILKDPSLIVRTTAVKILHQLQDYSAEDDLWAELYSEQNFRKGKSLWVRKHIARALYDFKKAGKTKLSELDVKRFLKFLTDDEKAVRQVGLSALNQFVSDTVTASDAPEKIQVRRWNAWAENQGIF